MFVFMQIYFRLSDWSIVYHVGEMLLSDWLGPILTPYTTNMGKSRYSKR